MLIFLAILVSGCCATTVAQQTIRADTEITLQFFETQFNKYATNHGIVCILVFVLQTLQNYQLYAEYTFDTINEDTRYEVEQQYADMIRRKLNPDVESICNPVQDGLRVDPENGGLDDSPNISDNQQIYSRDFGTEPEFCREITLWVNIYLQSQAEENFQPYKIMKVFILQHALSLGLRGREPRNEWREAAATSMTELILDRFYVCEAIIFSLFLRRQYAILDVDSARARNTLHFLPPEIWGVANPEIREYLTDIHHPTRTQTQFWFPRSRPLYNSVFINFQIFVKEACAYVRYLCNTGADGCQRARWVHGFVRQGWKLLKDPLNPSHLDEITINGLLDSLQV